MILCILEDADDDVDSFDAFVPHLYSLNGKTKNNNQIKRLMIEIEGSQKKGNDQNGGGCRVGGLQVN